MAESTTIYIIPSLEMFTLEFARRMTPPYDPKDGSSRAEISVLNNVRMAFVNQSQYPIPAGTSAEGAIARLVHSSAQTVGIIGREVDAPFVGAHSLSNANVAETTTLNPFKLLEDENDYEIGVFALDFNEVSNILNDDILITTLAREYPNDAIVISITDDPWWDDEIIDS
jgi:hypothetical protein